MYGNQSMLPLPAAYVVTGPRKNLYYLSKYGLASRKIRVNSVVSQYKDKFSKLWSFLILLAIRKGQWHVNVLFLFLCVSNVGHQWRERGWHLYRLSLRMRLSIHTPEWLVCGKMDQWDEWEEDVGTVVYGWGDEWCEMISGVCVRKC